MPRTCSVTCDALPTSVWIRMYACTISARLPQLFVAPEQPLQLVEQPARRVLRLADDRTGRVLRLPREVPRRVDRLAGDVAGRPDRLLGHRTRLAREVPGRLLRFVHDRCGLAGEIARGPLRLVDQVAPRSGRGVRDRTRRVGGARGRIGGRAYRVSPGVGGRAGGVGSSLDGGLGRIGSRVGGPSAAPFASSVSLTSCLPSLWITIVPSRSSYANSQVTRGAASASAAPRVGALSAARPLSQG